MGEPRSITIEFTDAEWDHIRDVTKRSAFDDEVAQWARRVLLVRAFEVRTAETAAANSELAEWWKLTGQIPDGPGRTRASHESMMRVINDADPSGTSLVFREIAVLLASLRHRANPKVLDAAADANGAGEFHLAVKLLVNSVTHDKVPVTEEEFMGMMWLMRELSIDDVAANLQITNGPVELWYRPRPDSDEDAS